MQTRNIIIGVLTVALAAVGIGFWTSLNSENQDLEERDNTVAQLQEQLQEQTVAIQDKDEEIATKSEQVTEQQSQLEAKDNEIAELRQQLEQRGQQASSEGNSSDGVPPQELQLQTEVNRLLGELNQLKQTQAIQPVITQRADEKKDPGVVHRALVNSLQPEINRGEIAVSTKNKRVAIQFGETVFFDRGKASISPPMEKILNKIGTVLRQFDDQHIQVEGHTDSMRIGGELQKTFASNWELSAVRSTTVVRHLIKNSGIEPTRISAAGYGKYRPITGNDTKVKRQLNRRVEFVLLPLDF